MAKQHIKIYSRKKKSSLFSLVKTLNVFLKVSSNRKQRPKTKVNATSHVLRATYLVENLHSQS